MRHARGEVVFAVSAERIALDGPLGWLAPITARLGYAARIDPPEVGDPTEIPVQGVADSGARRLAREVVALAMKEAMGRGAVPLNTTREAMTDAARGWIRESGEGVGSFEWWCALLDLDAAELRRRVERHREEARQA